MNNIRKKIIVFLMIFSLTSYFGAAKFALADDEEDDKDEESDDKNEVRQENVTQIIKLPDRYIQRIIMENILKKDSDRDGLWDENDPHPTIPEIYIVNDQNQNGIDDKYELNYEN